MWINNPNKPNLTNFSFLCPRSVRKVWTSVPRPTEIYAGAGASPNAKLAKGVTIRKYQNLRTNR